MSLSVYDFDASDEEEHPPLSDSSWSTEESSDGEFSDDRHDDNLSINDRDALFNRIPSNPPINDRDALFNRIANNQPINDRDALFSRIPSNPPINRSFTATTPHILRKITPHLSITSSVLQRGAYSVGNLAHWLLARETGWNCVPRNFGHPQRSMGSLGILRSVSLREIVEDENKMLNGCHVFLGFTQDCRYLLSYTLDGPNEPFQFDLEEVLEGAPITCHIHFWSFRPFSRATRITDSIRVFLDIANLPDKADYMQCRIGQWPDDDSRIVFLASWVGGSSFGDRDTDHHVALSVIPVPEVAATSGDSGSTTSGDSGATTSGLVAASPVGFHTSCISHPDPAPLGVSLSVPDLIVMHSGEFLFLYRFGREKVANLKRISGEVSPEVSEPTSRKRKSPEDGPPTCNPKASAICGDDFELKVEREEVADLEDVCSGIAPKLSELTSRKRKYFDIPPPKWDAKAPPVWGDFFELNVGDAGIWEVFLGDGTSHLIDISGERRSHHPLENVFRHTGAPTVIGKIDDRIDFGSIRIDIVMENAFQTLKTVAAFDIIMTRSFTCRLESVGAQRPEVVLNACIFLDGLKKFTTGGRARPALRKSSFVVPFSVLFNYRSGSCHVQYHRNGLAELTGPVVGHRNQTRELEKRFAALEKGRRGKQVMRSVHWMDNLNMSRGGDSVKSLFSPDGSVELTL
ncbi:hypothetical protein BV898_04650 [Hypsibius exemplaris]|uniref:DDB1- and CUL4-associated factor 15 WD40 repeat-containing domain-containing protein n=1 Tax=Hypsibius exemplaris TaxID=2072580 RepID=A0A1W0X1V0_HYPEX|nr:hypothetical protein BV898_04650 [Hypsibius exemplaris]